MFGQARKSLWIEVLLAQRDVDSGDKRSADEICQQELKNAVCITLKEKGAQEKGSLAMGIGGSANFTTSLPTTSRNRLSGSLQSAWQRQYLR